MLEKSMIYVIFKTIALVALAAVMLLEAGDKMEFVTLLSLALSCAIAMQYIVAVKGKYPTLSFIINLCCCILCVATKPESLMPIFVIILAEIIDSKVERQPFYIIFGCLVGLLLFIFSPSYVIILITIIMSIATCYVRVLSSKIEDYRKLIMRQKDDLAVLEDKIKDNNRFIKTLRYTAALEERNRLAAKLHDKVGHGISGSIIMLEASMMMFDKDGKKAKEGIEKSIAYLREGVDDIRAALREERPVRSNLGICEIKMKLEQFRANYGIITNLQEIGNLQNIKVDIWQCIHDNLDEVLTNLLKHSNASSFTLKLVAMNKVLSVEFKDNGINDIKDRPVSMGLGLEAMEERTIKCGGKFFVDYSKLGFAIRTIYICD